MGGIYGMPLFEMHDGDGMLDKAPLAAGRATIRNVLSHTRAWKSFKHRSRV